MNRADQVVVDRWAVVASRVPGIAARRAMRSFVLRAALVCMMVPGIVHTRNLVVWALRLGQASALALIATHFIALLIAVGLPTMTPASSEYAQSFLGRARARYGDRSERLRALSRAIALEIALWFAYPPIMLMVADRRLQWPVGFVIAATSWTIVWPLYRIALAQRREAERLTVLRTE